jgi:hypothetical protein
MEADYDTIKSVSLLCPPPARGRITKCRGTDDQKLDQPHDLSPLTNPNFVSQALTRMGDSAQSSCEKVQGKPWPGLGRRVEVMSLPHGLEGMKNMSI